MKDGVITIDLPAVESLGAALGDFSVALAKELKIAMTDTVTTIEKYAKHRCPVDTGNLRSSITPEIDGFKEGSVGTNSEYEVGIWRSRKVIKHSIVTSVATLGTFWRTVTMTDYGVGEVSGKCRNSCWVSRYPCSPIYIYFPTGKYSVVESIIDSPISHIAIKIPFARYTDKVSNLPTLI